MDDAVRQAHVEKIDKVKRELKTANGYRRKDLTRNLHRLQKELLIYDKYRRG